MDYPGSIFSPPAKDGETLRLPLLPTLQVYDSFRPTNQYGDIWNLLVTFSSPIDDGEQIWHMLFQLSLLIASDGSKKDNTGSYAYYLLDPFPETSFFGGEKCLCHFFLLSSFITEAYGALTVTCALLHIIPTSQHQIPIRLEVLIDNEAILDIIHRIIEYSALPAPLSPGYIIFHQLKCNLKQLANPRCWTWIKSHQIVCDEHTCLNNLIDTLAYQYRTAPSPTPAFHPIPDTEVIIFQNSHPIRSSCRTSP